MELERALQLAITRRQLFSRTSIGIGTVALASLMECDLQAQENPIDSGTGGLAGLPHFAPKAKRVIFLHQSVSNIFSNYFFRMPSNKINRSFFRILISFNVL